MRLPWSNTTASGSARNAGPVSRDHLAAIAAAVTAFLGRNARILSVRLLPTAQDCVGAWARQGRFLAQSSHNPRVRRERV